MKKQNKSLKRISLKDAQKYILAEDDFNNNFIRFYTIESLDNEWEKITYYTGRLKPKLKVLDNEIVNPNGYIETGDGDNIVYIMSNPAYPDLLKIGSTRKDIEERRKQLSSASGVPEPFKVEWILKLEGNEQFLEREIHNYLDYRRSNVKREFFDISLLEAIDTIKKIGRKYI